MKTRSKKSKLKFKSIVFILLFILGIASIYILHTIYLFKGIETPLRICLGLLLIDILIIFCICGLKLKRSSSIKMLILFSVILLLYSGGIALASKKVKKIYSTLSAMSSSKEEFNSHSTSIVVLKSSKIHDLEDAKSGTIGMINDEGNIAVYELPQKIIKNEKFNTNNVKIYDNHVDLLHDLLDKKIDAAFLPTEYVMMYESDEFETLETDTKIIYTTEEVEEVKDEETTVQKSLDEPFTILILGVDTTGNGVGSSFNGDALLLVTFNPKTLNSTILSIPRDSYMPISCFSGRKNKITNAGWQGERCIMNTLENYFGIKIDYYYKVNFNGVVSLVDAIGGVDVDIPYSFCEQNSKRKWGKKTVFVDAGKQHLNGEQALAFARHRKVTPYMRSYCGNKYTQNAAYWNDFTRGQNQQTVLKAVLDKLADTKDFSTIEKLLDTIKKNAKTNMSVETILSLYNLGKSILSNSNNKDQMLNMQRLYLSGKDASIYDYSFLHKKGSKLTTYNFIIYKESYEEVKHAMKVNLGLEKETAVKSFQFSVHNKYEEKIIGKRSSGTTDLVQMPNLVGKNVSSAQSFADKNGINLVINEVDGTGSQKDGQIISQSVPVKTDLSMLNSNKTVTITVVKKSSTVPTPEPTPDPEPEPTNPDSGENNSNSNDNSNENSQ